MRIRRLAHVSDLHIGRAGANLAAEEICGALLDAGVDHVVVTGDVTHKGRRREWQAFLSAFEPLLEQNRVTVIPGNHDRAGDDVASTIMPGSRVQAMERDGLYVVRLDSTAPHNRSLLTSHGHVGEEDIAAVEQALDDAPRGSLVTLALHHHLHPLPGDCFREDLVSWLGWPWCDELPAGQRLLDRIQGRCDLILHGHRHRASERQVLNGSGRTIGIFNAGSSPELGKVRVFQHVAGALDCAPEWLETRPVAPMAAPTRPAAAAA
jgi:Icc protein